MTKPGYKTTEFWMSRTRVMWNAVLQALSAIFTPIFREVLLRSLSATKAVDAPFNTDARRRWTDRVRKFTSRIRS